MEVIDDFLPIEQFRQIKDFMISPTETSRLNSFPWFLMEHDPAAQPLMFVHLFYAEAKINSTAYEVLSNLIDGLREKDSLETMIRIKANLYIRNDNLIEHSPHTDYPYSHKGAILYLDNSDGYTVIDSEKVGSKENRVVFFDPSIPHSSTNCTDSKYRSTINFNYL
tara:strand:+ start:1630 stop:2127 length:498 start_codon:yes stop_codon:yes gene_type:complete